MLILKICALCLAAVLTLIVGILVGLQPKRSANNYAFFGLALTMSGWALGIAAFLAVHNVRLAQVYAQTYYIFPLLIAATLTLFVQTFADHKPSKSWIALSSIGSLILSAIIVIKPGSLFERIVWHDWGKEVVLRFDMYVVYSLFLLIFYLAALVWMFVYSKRLRGLQALQAQAFFYGFLVTFIFGVGFNLILPAFGNYRFIYLGPLFISTFIIAISYSIIKHRMFDVRLVVARTFAYLVSLTALASIYGVIVFGILKIFFGREYRLSTQIIFSAATALAAIGFSGLKGFFDRVTNRLFYRDAYDAQELLDSLNRLFVANTDLTKLLKQSANVIADSFKAEFCYFGIRESETAPQRVIGTTAGKVTPEQIELVRRATPHIHHKIIVTDDLAGAFLPLKTALEANDIAVLGRLTANVHRSVEGLGYLVLGARRSGNPYNIRDLRTLEIIVNELVIATENSLRFEEIQHFNATLQDNVSDATRKLRTTNDKLKALDATKDEFITMASHQLRTPLTAVKGYLSMVLEGDAGKLNAQQTKLLEQSYASSQRMVYLIADLLNLSRLSTGKFVIDPSPTNLADVVQSEIDQLVETAKSREVGLYFEKPADFPALMLDETKTHQVVMNFIDNAIYYTPAGGDIRVSLADHAGYVEYLVTDTGIGVPKREQRHLFSKFYRAENARQARPDGTGLGLFMAKKVIVEQGGALIFTSTEGKGSTFGFRFNKHDHAVPEETGSSK